MANPPPVPVFLINPANGDFLSGRIPTPANENPAPILILKLLGLALALTMSGYGIFKIARIPTARSLWPMLFMIGMTAFGITITYWTIRPIIRNRRFDRPCTILYGELIDCKRVDDDNTIDWHLTYRFLSPLGQTVEGKWTTEGTVLQVAERALPPPGARIAIAYIDDKTHRVL